MTVVEAPRAVVCGSCGSVVELSARRARVAAAQNGSWRCTICRKPEKPVDPAELERMKRWWLARYSIDELLDLGREIGWVKRGRCAPSVEAAAAGPTIVEEWSRSES